MYADIHIFTYLFIHTYIYIYVYSFTNVHTYIHIPTLHMKISCVYIYTHILQIQIQEPLVYPTGLHAYNVMPTLGLGYRNGTCLGLSGNPCD